MDPSPSLIYYYEELGLKRDQLQLKEQFQNHPNFEIFPLFDIFWPLQVIYMSLLQQIHEVNTCFLMKTHEWVKKYNFQGISKHFWDLMSSRKLFLGPIPFQWSIKQVKWSYKTPYMSLPSIGVLWVSDMSFHEVLSCNENM